MTTKTKRSNAEPTNLRGCITVRCCGHMHKIGLSHSGDLVLFDHNKDELHRFLTLSELGSDPARCVNIYKDWQSGNVNNVPSDLAKFRHIDYEFAHRLQRKLRRSRLRAVINQAKKVGGVVDKELLKEYRTLSGADLTADDAADMKRYLASGRDPSVHLAIENSIQWVRYRTVKELVRRGWPVNVKWPKASNDWAKPAKNEFIASNLFDVDYAGIKLVSVDGTDPDNGLGYFSRRDICGVHSGRSNHIQVDNASGRLITSFPVTYETEAIPLQLIADVAEVGIANELVRKNRNDLNQLNGEQFRNATELLEQTAGVLGLEVRNESTSNTASISVTTSRLTLQAARLVIDTYRTIEPKIRAILRSNEKRLSAENRFPPPPICDVPAYGPVSKDQNVYMIPLLDADERKKIGLPAAGETKEKEDGIESDAA